MKAAEAESHRLEVRLEQAYEMLEKHVQDGLIQSLRCGNEKERITRPTTFVRLQTDHLIRLKFLCTSNIDGVGVGGKYQI